MLLSKEQSTQIDRSLSHLAPQTWQMPGVRSVARSQKRPGNKNSDLRADRQDLVRLDILAFMPTSDSPPPHADCSKPLILSSCE